MIDYSGIPGLRNFDGPRKSAYVQTDAICEVRPDASIASEIHDKLKDFHVQKRVRM